MREDFNLLIEEAILLELNIAELYMLFYRLFPGDSEFWWELAMEEQNHAALLKTARQMSKAEVRIPMEMLPAGVEELVSSNIRIRNAVKEFEISPDRNRAFQFALLAENGAGELHYDTFMKNVADSQVASVFKKLNGDDIDHAERIRKYMIDNQIPEMPRSDTGL